MPPGKCQWPILNTHMFNLEASQGMQCKSQPMRKRAIKALIHGTTDDRVAVKPLNNKKSILKMSSGHTKVSHSFYETENAS